MTASAALTELLERKLDTLEKLELVLALRGGPQAIVELARELQIGRDVLAQLAAEVARTGIITLADDHATIAASPEELALLDEAATLYGDDPRAMTRLMSKIAMDRIRRMAARSFADAFTLRKKKKDDDRG